LLLESSAPGPGSLSLIVGPRQNDKAIAPGGFVTSVLVVVFFVTAFGFRISGGNVPSWFPITMGAILCATISVVV
jgi:hypothetical protein